MTWWTRPAERTTRRTRAGPILAQRAMGLGGAIAVGGRLVELHHVRSHLFRHARRVVLEQAPEPHAFAGGNRPRSQREPLHFCLTLSFHCDSFRLLVFIVNARP